MGSVGSHKPAIIGNHRKSLENYRETIGQLWFVLVFSEQIICNHGARMCADLESFPETTEVPERFPQKGFPERFANDSGVKIARTMIPITC